MLLRFQTFLTLSAFLLAGSAPARRPWAVYYSSQAPAAQFRGYDLVVFDGDGHPALGPVLASGATVVGYLSLCEIEEHRESFAAAKKAGLLLGGSPNWPGTYFVDVRDPRWRKIVVGQLAPAILAQGFRGFFLDTLDDAGDLERRDPTKYQGTKAAAVMLVQEIRRANPTVTLMVNRAYDLLPEIAGSVDIVLGESVYGTYDFAAKAYRPVPAMDYHHQVELLMRLKSVKPSLRICTLDYWDPADREGIRRAYREERSHGFDPYVATISLDQLMREPR